MSEKEYKIYTKTGDRGTTSLIGGERALKSDNRIEAYGDVDELISVVSLLREENISGDMKVFLLAIMDKLMIVATILATGEKANKQSLPEITSSDVEILEKEIDRMQNMLPVLSSFILPGGNRASAVCHIARTVCRRAERHSIRLAQEVSIDAMAIVYLNRLSDFLFVLGRKIVHDSGGTDILWNTKNK